MGTLIQLAVSAIFRWARSRIAERRTFRLAKHGVTRQRATDHPLLAPMLQPFTPVLDSDGPTLAAAYRCGNGAPLVYRPHGNQFVNVLRSAYLQWLAADTRRKPVFEVDGWGILPAKTAGNTSMYPHSSGAMLEVRLASGENSLHFKHSLAAWRSPTKRLVAIAGVDDLRDGTARVRCMYVDATSFDRGPDDPKTVLLASSTSMELEEGCIFTLRQKDVPAEAIWLMCNMANVRASAQDWGQKAEWHQSQPNPQSPQCHAHKEAVDRLLKADKGRNRMAWLLFGPGFSAAILLASLTLWLLNDEGSDQWATLAAISVIWAFITTAAMIWIVLDIATNHLRKKLWLQQDKMQPAEWTGGTLRGLAVGRLMRSAPKITDTNELPSKRA